jgi:hypothetical protein
VKDVISKNPALFGKQGDGVDLESSVEEGNQKDWIPTRVSILKPLGLKEVLRPVFCSIDMNLTSHSGGADASDLLFDRGFGVGTNATVDDKVYAAAIAKAGQSIVDGRNGHQLVGGKNNKPLTDTVFGFTFPMRSRQDTDYTTELQRQHIVDIDFVKDVLSIDFTRPLYSPTRCGMLDAMPDVAPADLQFDKVKAAVIAKLEGTQDPALAKLLANLKDPNDAAAHDFEVKKFVTACADRAKADGPAYAMDLLKYASHLRKAAKRAVNATNGGITEFEETLPADNLPEPTAGFDPVTCKLP